MNSSYTLLFDIREAGFPLDGVFFVYAFLLLGSLLLVGQSLHPGSRKVMQSFIPFPRLPFPVIAWGFLLFICALAGPDVYARYTEYKSLHDDLAAGRCPRVEGSVENFQRRKIARARSSSTTVTFRVQDVRFRYSDRGGNPGYRDVKTPLKNHMQVRISYCGAKRRIVRLKALRL